MSEQDIANQREALEVRVIALLAGELSEEEAYELESVLSRHAELSSFRDQMAILMGDIYGAIDEISPPVEDSAPIHLDEVRRRKIFKNELPVGAVLSGKDDKKWWHLGLLEMVAIFIVGGLLASVMLPTIRSVRHFAEDADMQHDDRVAELKLSTAKRAISEPLSQTDTVSTAQVASVAELGDTLPVVESAPLIAAHSLRSVSTHSESQPHAEAALSELLTAEDQVDGLTLHDDSIGAEASILSAGAQEVTASGLIRDWGRSLADDESAKLVSTNGLIRSKLDCIVIPQVNFIDISMAEFVRSIRKLSSVYDGDGDGINLVVLMSAEGAVRISLQLEDASLRDILLQVSKLLGAELIEAEDVVILRKLDTSWIDLGERDASLQAIVIPQISFADESLSEVVDELEQLSVEYDPQREGIRMSYEALNDAVPLVSMQLHNLSIDRVIQLIAQQIGYQFSINGKRVHLQPAREPVIEASPSH
jgi:hypothetical protein